MPQLCNCDATVTNIYSHLQSCTMPVWRYCDVSASFSMYFNTQSDFSTTWGIFLFQKWSKMFQNFPQFFRTNFRRSFRTKVRRFSMKRSPIRRHCLRQCLFGVFFKKKLCQMRINSWSKKKCLKKSFKDVLPRTRFVRRRRIKIVFLMFPKDL